MLGIGLNYRFYQPCPTRSVAQSIWDLWWEKVRIIIPNLQRALQPDSMCLSRSGQSWSFCTNLHRFIHVLYYLDIPFVWDCARIWLTMSTEGCGRKEVGRGKRWWTKTKRGRRRPAPRKPRVCQRREGVCISNWYQYKLESMKAEECASKAEQHVRFFLNERNRAWVPSELGLEAWVQNVGLWSTERRCILDRWNRPSQGTVHRDRPKTQVT